MRDLIIQKPRSVDGDPTGLVLLFHGVGSNAENLRALGEGLAVGHPRAWVVSVQSPDPSDLGQGWQWFSVRGVTQDNRAYRVATAMPRFVQAVTTWQDQTGLDADRTTLVGFSQGAIMALEATRLPQPVASCVAALAGRFAAPPQRAPSRTRIHLLHGQLDGVVPVQASIEAHAQLVALHADVSLDLIPDLGHGIDGRMTTLLHERLAAAV